jgi:hypothetical protein
MIEVREPLAGLDANQIAAIEVLASHTDQPIRVRLDTSQQPNSDTDTAVGIERRRPRGYEKDTVRSTRIPTVGVGVGRRPRAVGTIPFGDPLYANGGGFPARRYGKARAIRPQDAHASILGATHMDKSACQAQYDVLHPRLARLEAEARFILDRALSRTGIKIHALTSRVKALDSAVAKIARLEQEQGDITSVSTLPGIHRYPPPSPRIKPDGSKFPKYGDVGVPLSISAARAIVLFVFVTPRSILSLADEGKGKWIRNLLPRGGLRPKLLPVSAALSPLRSIRT